MFRKRKYIYGCVCFVYINNNKEAIEMRDHGDKCKKREKRGSGKLHLRIKNCQASHNQKSYNKTDMMSQRRYRQYQQ
jgi:hypothetical protein